MAHKHIATFEKHLASRYRFRMKVNTGMPWPKDIYGRRYSLETIKVTNDDVTLAVTSADIDPRDHNGYNPLEHGNVVVPFSPDITAMLNVAVQAADPDFFAKYTRVPNAIAWDRERERGVEFSKPVEALTRR